MGSFKRTVIRNQAKKVFKEENKDIKKCFRIKFKTYWKDLKRRLKKEE